MAKTKKSVLKQGYYYECKDFYSTLPDILPEAPKYEVEVFGKTMTNREILDTYKIEPYESFEIAASVIASIMPTLEKGYKGRIVYFTDSGTTYRFGAWRDDDGQFNMDVNGFGLGNEWVAEDGVVFSNKLSEPLESVPLKLKIFDPYVEMVEWLYLNTGNQFTNEMKGNLLAKLKDVLK